MQRCDVESRARRFFHRPPQFGRLKRAGARLVVAVCKAAVLVATLEASAQVLELSPETEECAEVEMASSLPGGGSRGTSLKQLPLLHVRSGFGVEHGRLPARTAAVARAGGHRLSNGLCAPLRC